MSDMKTCRLCHSTTSSHRNDIFDGLIRDISQLAEYITHKRFNQAGNVLIKAASSLNETYNGCCTPHEEIKKYGDMTIKLIKLGQEIGRMDKGGDLDMVDKD